MTSAAINALVALPPGKAARLVAALGWASAVDTLGDFYNFAHDGQNPPAKCSDGSDWQTWVIKAGRGFGKTRAGAEWVADVMRRDGNARVALVAATLDEARRVMIEGDSGLIAVAGGDIAAWQASRRLLRFTNGAEATIFSGASPDALRGPQHSHAWCDELAKWEKAEDSWDMLQLGLRIGERPRVLVTTTPRPGALLTRILARPDCVMTEGRTDDNPHVPAAYVATIRSMYDGTRLGRQEIEGELLGASGALWTVELIERCRTVPHPGAARLSLSPEGEGGECANDSPSPSGEFRVGTAPGCSSTMRGMVDPKLVDTREARRGEGLPAFTRTLIAVDPPSGEGTCGIIACARDREGHVHVLADHSVTGRSPEGWARAVVASAQAHGTREVIAESNQGGRMVKSILLAAAANDAPDLHVRLVTAVHGKSDRAEPVAHLFEAGRAWFAGRFPALEAQLLGMIAGGEYDGPGASPDRADAMVWGVSTLSKEWGEVRIRVV